MQIKRFEAKNMTEALRQIKRELGPEAVILSAKDRRRENRLLGISRKIGVEVMAAVDDDVPAMNSHRKPARRKDAAAQAALHHRAAMNDRKTGFGFLPKINDVVRLNGNAKRSAAMEQGVATRSNPTTERPYGMTGQSETQHASKEGLSGDAGGSSMGRYLAKTGLSVGSLSLDKKMSTPIALVGNAGVGKTTSIAKLAARFRSIHKKSVGLLALNGLRLGGAEQLQYFADSMNLPLEMPAHDKELTAAWTRLHACDVILVDTPAVHPGDREGLARIRTGLQKIGKPRTLLVLSAEGREEDLQDTALRYTPLTPIGTMITKTDLTRSYADLVNFLCRNALPVYFFSDGHRVPGDLTAATLERLAARFLQNGLPAPHAPSPCGAVHESSSVEAGHQVYLANKNSDIFHRPDCKWIRLINQANIVEFNSFAEALNNRFKPCRYCNPQHLSITGILSQEGAAL